MPEADETIITRFIAQTSDAVADAQRYREEIDRIKAAAIDMSTSNKVALKDLQKSWIDLAEAQKASEIKQVKAALPEVATADQTKAAETQIQSIAQQYDALIARIRTAFGEARAEEKQYFAQQGALIKQTYKQAADDAKESAKAQAEAAKNRAAIQKEIEKQIAAEVKAQYKESAQYAAEYARVTQQGYGVMSEGAKTFGLQVQGVKQQIQQISATTGQSFQKVAEQLRSAGVPAAQINQALKELNVQTKETGQGFRLFGQEINNVGDLARVVLLGVFGVGVIQMFRQLINSITEATKAGYEFGKAIFQLEVGARALQRAGVDVTIEQIYGQLGSLQERFKIFTTKDLVVGTAAFLNLNRDMGFTREQLFKLQDAVATLAIVNGRAMDEVQKTVALALSSGYTEGLQRLGVSINRVNIANEAGRIGFAKTYMALTEQQRALATYNLVIRKTAIYQEDLQKYFDTAPGAIDRTKTQFQELKNQVGLLIATNLGTYLRDINRLLEGLNEAIEEAKLRPMASAILNVVDRLKDMNKELTVAQQLVKGVVEWMLKFAFIKSLPSPFGQIIASLERMAGIKAQLDEGILGDEAVGETERQANKLKEAVSNSLEELETFQKDYDQRLLDLQKDHDRDIEKLQLDADRRRTELAKDLERDLAKIKADGNQKLLDLEKDYYNRLRDIEEKLGRDVAEENTKYAQDVAQANRDAAIRRAEAEAQYRENEIRAEIRFQEDMRRLREGFLFDLEDALHERDARQVLRLIRQYNLQKSQTERQFEIEKDERARAFQLELKQIEAQRQERLRNLAEEHAARIAALQAQAAYERELARRKYEEDKLELARQLEEQKQERIAKALEAEEELKTKLQQAKADRDALLVQQKADLEAERDALLKEIGEKLWGAIQVTTADGLKQLYDALASVLGPGKDTDSIFQYYVNSAKSASAQVAGELAAIAVALSAIKALAASIGGASVQGFSTLSIPGAAGTGAPTPSSAGGTTSTPRPQRRRDMGGEVYKGEVYKVHKDETFVPAVNGRILNVKQSQEAVAGASAGRTNRIDGKVRIGVALSPDLIGEIIDTTLGETADVVVGIERRRK